MLRLPPLAAVVLASAPATTGAQARDLVAETFGVSFGDSVAMVAEQLAARCGETRRIDVPVPGFPLAARTETHLVCLDVETRTGAVIDEVAFAFGDDALGLVEARGGALFALLELLEEEPFDYLGYLGFFGAALIADEEADAAWLLSPEALHAHLFLWPNPHLPSIEAHTPFEPSAARPDAFVWKNSVAQLTAALADADTLHAVEENAVWLPSGPARQHQVNCFGVAYAGFPRKVEAVFGDDELQLLWILTGSGEEDRVRRALIEAYGPPIYVGDDVEAFDDWRVALRKDKPEVLMVTDALAPLYRTALGSGPNQLEEHTMLEIPSVRIWDAAPHNAFTDLVRFRDRFYCSFREGSGHVPGEAGSDGKARVITSVDGVTWESVALLEEDGVDLRDPKLSVTPDGRLLVMMGGSIYDGETLRSRAPRVAYSNAEGTAFREPERVTLDPAVDRGNDWLWRVTWHDGTAWSVNYQPSKGDDWGLHLMKSPDGRTWDLAHTFELADRPNETTLRFGPEGTLVALARREGGARTGLVGHAAPPYDAWTWNELDRRLGGPDLALLPDGTWIAGTRQHDSDGGYATILGRLDLTGAFEPLVRLPSAGDTSYPGLVVHAGELWVSYYASHEERTSIYLARVPLEALRP